MLTSSTALSRLGAVPGAEQHARGYAHTLAEIRQQPDTWRATASAAVDSAERLHAFVERAGIGPGHGLVVLTGSGSSHYVGECLALPLQEALSVPVHAVPTGLILTNGDQIVPAGLECLTVSFARSGDSPESSAAVDLLLARRPGAHHLIITCNNRGRLASAHRHDPRVHVHALDPVTCDRSLVMTSSFTNMVLAGHVLGGRHASRYLEDAQRLAELGRTVIERSGDALEDLARAPFRSAAFLASGSRLGAARECSLKLLEMTEGHVRTLVESYLGVRHGPMSTIHEDTLVVCFLSSDPTTRAYEMDLLHELDRKELGARKLVLGEHVPAAIVGDLDTVVECPGAAAIGDDRVAIVDAVAGQLLAFFRCLHMGLKPDAPSTDGVINRVVEEFEIHKR
jgi:tagatose-6-phosphate ketose/aldose isomerase